MVKVSDMIPKRIIDQNAESIEDIQKEHSYMSRKRVWDIVNQMVIDGKSEQVWKVVNKKLIRAYRPKKK